jgi:hypothetical protein
MSTNYKRPINHELIYVSCNGHYMRILVSVLVDVAHADVQYYYSGYDVFIQYHTYHNDNTVTITPDTMCSYIIIHTIMITL